jgi:glycosyltransferase involved in cell wall biosynthesis
MTMSVGPKLRLAAFRYFPAIGGAEHLARRLLQEIGGRVEADVLTLLTSNRSDWLRVMIEGVRDHDEHYEVDGRPVRALARWPAPVRRHLRRLAPLYHVPGSPVPTLMGRALAPGLADAVPQTGLIHNIFMGREPFSLALMLAAHRSGRPFVFTPLRHQRPFGWSSPAFRELYRRADVVIALTRTEAAWLIAHGARPATVEVIGAGPLSDPTVTPDRARAVVGPGRIVLFLGQLHDYKGFASVLAAARRFRHLPDVRFVFAGPDVRGHARRFENAGPNIRYLSAVDDALRDSLLQACTVLCVPSSRESFGLVLVEAWNCGKPVIGGPAPATRELIDEGIDGWSVRQEPTLVADRLGRLLGSPELAARMGASGKAKVERQFSWKAIADAHLAIYSRLQSASRPS